MKILKIAALVLVLLLAYCTLNMKVIRHDEQAAAKVAVQFGQAAFVLRDSNKAYEYFSTNAKQSLAFEKFVDIVTKLHPKSFPSQIQAAAYAPVPGQKQMSIFLKGDDQQGAHYYYRIVMDGDEPSGYQVVGFLRIKESEFQLNNIPLK